MLLGKLRISGHSMEPVLNNNDLILISYLFYIFKHPQINDIVAFRFNDKTFVKRITKSENQKYFLEGDNKSDSLDSSGFGWIPKNKILGKYFYKLT
jgi:phage repressor protein C with HTH and peptisase S24 domain